MTTVVNLRTGASRTLPLPAREAITEAWLQDNRTQTARDLATNVLAPQIERTAHHLFAGDLAVRLRESSWQ